MGLFNKKNNEQEEKENKKRLKYLEMARYIVDRKGKDSDTIIGTREYNRFNISISINIQDKIIATPISDETYKKMENIYNGIIKEEKEQEEKLKKERLEQQKHNLQRANYIAGKIGEKIENKEKNYLENYKYENNTVKITKTRENENSKIIIGINKKDDISDNDLAVYLEDLSNFIKESISNGVSRKEIIEEINKEERLKAESKKIYDVIDTCFNYYRRSNRDEIIIAEGRFMIKIKRYEKNDENTSRSNRKTDGYQVKLRSDEVYNCKSGKVTVYKQGQWEDYLTETYNKIKEYQENINMDEKPKTLEKKKQM